MHRLAYTSGLAVVLALALATAAPARTHLPHLHLKPCHGYVTCQQAQAVGMNWTCFVFAAHIRKCSPAEARQVLVGKYRQRLYRSR